MSGMQFTPSQQEAIDSRDQAVLVSAGAGSGKTRVLVERLMSYITDEKEPRDVDSFLIITFTKAAAAELRGRISQRLGELCGEDPGNRRLRRQAALCARAPIGTIHSFCGTILREHAQLLGIAPDFRVAEEEKCRILQARVLERVLERAYSRIGEDGDFRALADTLGAGRDDRRLEEAIPELYEKMCSHIYPEKWAEDCRRALELEKATDAGETLWGRWLLEDAAQSALGWAERMEALALLGDEDGQIGPAYSQSLRDTAASLRDFARGAREGWDRARDFLPIEFPRLKSLRSPKNPALAEKLKGLRKLCKEKGAEAYAQRFAQPSLEALEALRAAAPGARALLRLTLEFAELYRREKLRLSLLDFSDLEHLSVKLLLSPETGEPTAAAREISRRFTEIMVDEYQDVNAVQDAIFTAVSRQGKNLFMVGDVKQSIYRFRLADPGIFLERYDRFGGGEGGKRILLRENFRSRGEVLQGVNHLFRRIMSRALGELDYDDNAALVPGGSFPSTPGPLVTMTVAEPDTEDEDAPDAAETEATLVAQTIRELVDRGEQVAVADGWRDMEWGDVAILLRSPKSLGGTFRQALEARGIPVQGEQGTDFFSAPEVTVALHLLAVTDNPRQDLPLISLLRSPLFGFTADELAAIRGCRMQGDFYEALCLRGETEEKCRRFLETLALLRRDARDLPLGAFLWRAYGHTDALAVACALEGGAARRENLLRLFQAAVRFERTGDGSLSGFLEYMEALRRDNREPFTAAPQGGGVHILSIHKSKGLEFPVVFLSGTGRRFNKRSAGGDLPVHADLGLGLDRVDLEQGVMYPTIARLAVSRKLMLEGLSEEMRVLYVALTRARERLYITAALRKPEERMKKLLDFGGDRPDPCLLEAAQCPADWLLPVFAGEDSPVPVCVVKPGETLPLPAPSPETEAMEELPPDPGLKAMLDYRYPHAAACALPVKLTATELKRRGAVLREDTETASLVPPETPVFRAPELGGEKKLSAPETGTAVHLALRHLRPERCDSREGIRAELRRLASEGILRREEARAVDLRMLENFFFSELGELFRTGGELLREQRFSMLAPAERYFPGGEGEEILLQGIVDCCIRQPDGLVILDFKTDRVFGEALRARAREYAPQLQTYAQAMGRLTGQPVKRCVLVFLRAGETVELPVSPEKD